MTIIDQQKTRLFFILAIIALLLNSILPATTVLAERENFEQSFYNEDYFCEVNEEYEVIIENKNEVKKYTLTFKTWEAEKPEVISAKYFGSFPFIGTGPYDIDATVEENEIIFELPSDIFKRYC